MSVIITNRELFAGLAMQGIIANPNNHRIATFEQMGKASAGD